MIILNNQVDEPVGEFDGDPINVIEEDDLIDDMTEEELEDFF
jgi:hypothetical protein